MKKYLIHLEAKSDITLFPDSQKIFGWLISQISKDNDENKVTKLINDIFDKSVKCMVSNVLPKDYIPFPKEFILNKLSEVDSENTEKQQKNKKIYEEIKKIDFIKKSDLKEMIDFFIKLRKRLNDKNNGEIEISKKEEFKKYLYKNQNYIQKFRLDDQFYNLPGLLNKAYTVPLTKIINKNTGKKMKEFIIMIKTNSSIIIKWLEKNKDICTEEFLGPKGTQGYNVFLRKKISVEKENDDLKSDFYLNMGMLFPKNIIYDKSYIDLYVSDRKSFEITEKIKKVIGFINSGSLIYSKEEVFKIGESIRKNEKKEYNILHKNAIVFGNSYLEPFDTEIFGGKNEK